jgi:RND family efflux transporter MFP subunit
MVIVSSNRGDAVQERHSGHAGEESRVSIDFATDTGRRVQIIAVIAGVILVAGFAAVGVLKARQRNALSAEVLDAAGQPPTVVVVTARKGSGAHGLSLPGETAAWVESTIYSRVNGYVASWNVDIGAHVTKGQILAEIDTPELDAQLDAARANLNAAKAQVHVRDAEAQFATTTNERWRDSPKGVVSDQEREAKRADFDSAQARLVAAQAQVALEQAQVDNIQGMIQYKHVTAPFDGTVVERRIDIGNLVTAGSSATTVPLFRVSQERPMRVFVDAPQSLATDLLRPGLTAEVRASAFRDRVFHGTVARTSRAINPQARTLKVEIDLDNSDRTLIPGMYVDVSFALGGAGLPQVPAAALVFRAGGPQVAVIDAQGRVIFREVTIARDQGEFVEMGSGIAAGDKVVLNISSQIANGDLVRPRELADAAPSKPADAPGATDTPAARPAH